MEFRHELKHLLSRQDLLILRQRFQAVAQPDPHAIHGTYHIRSLYFDTPSDKALREKLDGISCREKFRIRLYNGDPATLHLEKKSKLGGLGNKQHAPLTPAEAEAILRGEWGWMLDSNRPLLAELYYKMRTQLGLRHPYRPGLHRPFAPLPDHPRRGCPGAPGSEVGQLPPRHHPGCHPTGGQAYHGLFQIRPVPHLWIERNPVYEFQ